TIQKRVTDAYYARNKRGFYMGGRIPYGYRLKSTVIDNIRTSMYEEVPEESEQLKLIYSMYADPSNSLGDIIRYLNKHGIKHLRGSSWNSARLSDMLRNPVYVEADIDVYNFFKSQGANVYNPASDFTGYNACYLYKGTVSTTRKQCDLTDKEIVLAPHRGFISSSTWLACRIRCLSNRQSTKTCKPKNSWLTGKVKCGNCGYALVIRKAKTKWGRYFVCSQGGHDGNCKGTGCTVYADVLEEYMLNAIRDKLSEFKKLSDEKENQSTPKVSKNKIRLAQIDEEIGDLLSKVGSANSILMKYINDKVSELDTERQTLQEEIVSLTCSKTESKMGQITDHVKKWQDISFEDKQAVVDALIKVIKVANGNIEITWKI
ncbi:recombinase family protein, partial [Anaerotignum lactatifermentans]|uniref:recombinase family protein n=1 Tax=Anaerotignum lactatifermentans TaxID=160404 RepID=UPI00307CC0E1